MGFFACACGLCCLGIFTSRRTVLCVLLVDVCDMRSVWPAGWLEKTHCQRALARALCFLSLPTYLSPLLSFTGTCLQHSHACHDMRHEKHTERKEKVNLDHLHMPASDKGAGVAGLTPTPTGAFLRTHTHNERRTTYLVATFPTGALPHGRVFVAGEKKRTLYSHVTKRISISTGVKRWPLSPLLPYACGDMLRLADVSSLPTLARIIYAASVQPGVFNAGRYAFTDNPQCCAARRSAATTGRTATGVARRSERLDDNTISPAALNAYRACRASIHTALRCCLCAQHVMT